MTRVLFISDTSDQQVNGVVRTLSTTIELLRARGMDTQMISVDGFASMPMPGYREIRLATSTKGLKERMLAFDPDYVHIATEGRVGWAARRICLQLGWAFTTSYHTDFPGYLKRHYRLPEWITYNVLKRFHAASAAIMVATPTVENQLRSKGFERIVRWSRGVDTSNFVPRIEPYDDGYEPSLLYVGRVSKEKNIEAFLDLQIAGLKVVVGDGPMLKEYQRLYPAVLFMGQKEGRDLAKFYSAADVFVFPSKTDTFGLVNIEAMACGTPVAAYPVQGPIDILTPESGSMNRDLGKAVEEALLLDRAVVSQCGAAFTWRNATEQFVANLVHRNGTRPRLGIGSF